MNYKHGLYNKQDYTIWSSIMDRCYNVNNKSYINYGGRGITFYWKDDPYSFLCYLKTLDNYGVEKLTLDRIENDGNYEPGNLRWTTRQVQKNNERIRTNKTGFIGIDKCPKCNNIYRSRITINNKGISIGRYKTIKDAVESRNNYIIKNNLEDCGFKIQPFI